MRIRIIMPAIAALIAAPVLADTLHVPDQYSTIQAAIDAAKTGDEVVVADGVYAGTGNRDVSFLGKAITVRSAGGAGLCTIECDGSYEDPHRGFVFTSGETRDAVLEGFTIRGGGTLPGAIADDFNGGGILINNNSAPTIRACVLIDNACGCWGGAICSTNGQPLIIDCRIVGNHSDDDGGGIFAWGSGAPDIVNTVIVGNDTAVTGGGVVLFAAGGTVTNSTIVGNHSGWIPGLYGNVTVRNSIIWGNTGGTSGQQLSGADVAYSVVEGGYAGESVWDIDPMFAAPGDYHLDRSSPLVDAGLESAIPAGVDMDVDGDPRVIGSAPDVGADEMRIASDVNLDGAVDVSDLIAVIAAWGPCAGCAEDVTGDGEVGVADLIQLLAEWG